MNKKRGPEVLTNFKQDAGNAVFQTCRLRNKEEGRFLWKVETILCRYSNVQGEKNSLSPEKNNELIKN